jgi:hypothetical protein
MRWSSFIETDPTVPDHVKAITQTDIDTWNAGGSGGGAAWTYYPDTYRFYAPGFGGHNRKEFWTLSTEIIDPDPAVNPSNQLTEMVAVHKLEADRISGPYLQIVAPSIDVGLYGDDNPGRLNVAAPAYFRNAWSIEHTVLGGINISAADIDRPDELPYGADERSVQYALSVTHQTLGRTVEIDKEGIIRAREFTDLDGNPIGGGGGVEEAPSNGKVYGRQNEAWTEVAGSGGVEEAPVTNKMYARRNEAWAEFDTADFVKSVNSKTPDASGAVALTHTDVGAEKAFTKNNAFNKNFGTSSGTVAQGNHTHTQYATTSHTHTEYATSGHTHSQYAGIGVSYTKAESDGKYELKGGGAPGGHNGTDAIQIAHKGISLGKDQQGSTFKSYPVIEMQSTSGVNGGLNEHTGYRLSVGMTAGWGDQRFMFNCGSTWGAYNATPALTIANAGCTSADFIATSDERLKDNITTVPIGLVDSLIGREWEWKESGQRASGVVAQEVEKVLPHVVSEDPEGTKAVSYGQLTAYLIEELKDCRRRIAELEDQKLGG